MSKYEEQAFQIGKAVKSDLPSLKNQLARLKEDLGRFVARKPDGPVIAPLRERIKELEAQIAAATEHRKAEQPDEAVGVQSTGGRFPPRHR